MVKIRYIPPRSVAKARISSLEKKPEVPGNAASGEGADDQQPEVNGIARRKPLIRSMFCTFAIAAITEPAAMNRSALKKAGHQVKEATDVGADRDADHHVADLAMVE